MSHRARVIVVGGGPAGLLAAGSAAEAGASVVLLERGPKMGRKLRMTGKGRCNITNATDVEGFVRAFAPNGRFLYGPFARFFRDDTLALFERLGVHVKGERGGRIFPLSDSALEVAAALERWVRDVGVDVRLNTRVKGILSADGRLQGVSLYHGSMDGAAAIIATGGLSYPGTGSSGDGYAVAESVGHSIVPTRPALAPLLADDRWPGTLSGLALRNVRASLADRATGKAVASEFGEMLFTHTGVSGPIILSLSRVYTRQSGPLDLRIDLKPAVSAEELTARFIREFVGAGTFGVYLRQLMPKSLAPIVADLSGVPADRPLSAIRASERSALVHTLKNLPITLRGLAPIEQAIVTSGGVRLEEIDPRTLMSRRVDGLYFAGEVLDLDAMTGGYNLQAAFSTGYVAGVSAAARAAALTDGPEQPFRSVRSTPDPAPELNGVRSRG